IEIQSFEDILVFLRKYDRIVIKPVFSNQGRNIYRITRKRRKYVVSYLKENKVISKKQLKLFYEEKIAKKPHMAQKYIDSTNKEGHPFDCRIHVEKNGRNKWSNTRNFIRIGIGQTVISNINQGGGIADIKKFLKANYEDNWEMI